MSSEITDEGNWDEDFVKKEQKVQDADQKRLPWMSFPSPGEYQVRLCGNFVKFHRWWSPFTGRIITHLSFKDQDPAWNAGFWPRLTFAIHVLDRGDVDDTCPTGKLKILEKGKQIFESFSDYKRLVKVNPAGKTGPDFVIRVEWPGGNKRQAKYTVNYLPTPSPWTEQEVEMIRTQHADLKKIYAPTALEKIKEEWEKLPDDAKIPPVREGKGGAPATVASVATPPAPAAPAPAETATVSADEDDLFGDNDGSTNF